MANKTEQNSARIAKNSFLLTIRLIITMCISIYTSRVILNILGVEDYGIYNVVGGFVAVFSSLTDSLSRAFSRFITVAIAKDDVREQQQVFSANCNILLVVSVLIIVGCELVGTWYFSEIVNIPIGRIPIINTIFQLSLLSFFLTLGKIPCVSLIIAHEKSRVYALLGILEAILKLVIVYFLILSNADKLILYCSLLVGVNLLSLIYTLLYCKCTFEGFRYIRKIPSKFYGELIGFASWSFVALSARICNTQGIILVVNKYCGVVVNAALGIVSQVEASTRQFVTNIAVAVNPQIVKSYTTGDIDYMRRLIVFATKCFAFIVLYYAIPFSLEADTILHLWLGNVPNYTANLLRLVFGSTLFMVMANPLEVAIQATGKVRKFQMQTSGVLLIFIPIAWFILHYGGNVYIVYIALIILYVFLLFIQFYNTRHITGMSISYYIFNVLFRIVAASFLIVLVLYQIVQSMEPTFFRLCISCLMSLVVTTICAFWVGFTNEEFHIVWRVLKKYIKVKVRK